MTTLCGRHSPSLARKSWRGQKTCRFTSPSFIYRYKDGVAKVEWQLNPDGMYYMEDDGFGMTPDIEYNIYGFIDREDHLLSKFRHLSHHGLDEKLDEMRREAQNRVSNS